MLKSQNKMIVLQLTQILQEKSFVNTDGDLNPCPLDWHFLDMELKRVSRLELLR